MYYAGYVNREDFNFAPFSRITFRIGEAIKKAAYDSMRTQSRTAVMSAQRYVLGEQPEYVFSNGKAMYGATFEAYTLDGSNVTTVGVDEQPIYYDDEKFESSVIIRTPSLKQLIDYCVEEGFSMIKIGYNGHIIDTVNLKELSYG